MFRRILILALVAALLAVSCGRLDDGGSPRLDPACPPGIGRGIWDGGFFGEEERQGPREVRRLLENPDFGASGEAAGDLRAGIVDPRLVAALRAVTREHSICVDAFKEGHYFIEGVEDGPRIPEGYGEAGGLPNTHYHGRAATSGTWTGSPSRATARTPRSLGSAGCSLVSLRRRGRIR